MSIRWIISFLALIGLTVRADDAGTEFFESRVRPILVEKCFSCHSAQAKKLKAGLRLDSRDAALKGGDSGPAIVPGDSAKSRLIEAISYNNVDLAMPPKEKLADQQIADLTTWVKMGAPWPGGDTKAAANVEQFDLHKRKREHWAWQPVLPPNTPAVKDVNWPHDPIDSFILAKLEAAGLRPAKEADRRTLIRRVYFDLIGLPPTSAQVDAFVNDPSPTAFDAVVDHLLASPHFGERWARHWLDLVRYAETLGHEFDYEIANAWRYRDYVVRAFNQDVPYDQFILEHVAGDLIDKPRRTPEGYNQSIVGTGFWYLGEEVHSPVDVRLHQADRIDNRIDVLGKTFLGLTIACARCHDHKFDAISTADYYALFGYLKSTRQSQRAVNEEQIRAAAGKLSELKRQISELMPRDPTRSANTSTRLGDVDLAKPGLDGWMFDGPAFDRCQPGDFAIRGETIEPVGGQMLAHSGLLSPRLEGALRSPTFVIDRPYLHIRAPGKHARINVVIDNFVVIRDPIYGGLKRQLNSDSSAWITIDLSMWKGHEAYLEFIDSSVPDPSSPKAQKDGWAAVSRVLLSQNAKPPPAPEANGSDLRPDQSTLAPLLKKYRELEAAIPAPIYVPATHDGEGLDERVFIRGNPKNLGQPIPPRFLEALEPTPAPSRTPGSGRLQLARKIADPANPLTARVMANRVWHHLFARGLVASVDNFGALGESPSHPELLDHLADRFVKGGWSTKRLIRAIVLSNTYRMSSRPAADDHAERTDPANILLHRQNVRRLQAESIRDAILFVSGRIDLTAGGPGVPIHITSFMEGRGRPGASGPLDGAGRRSVYLEVRRNFLPPMLLAFDAPIPMSTMGRRSVSNVPAQALILMNDPFVAQQANLWAKRVLADTGLTPGHRVGRMYASAFARPPTADETASVLQFARTANDNEERVWTDVAHALMNAKEFIFVN